MPMLDLILRIPFDGLVVENVNKRGSKITVGAIREKVGERLALFGNVDPIYVLGTGDGDLIAEEVKRQFETAGRDGAFVCHSSIVSANVSVEAVNAMLAASRECRY